MLIGVALSSQGDQFAFGSLIVGLVCIILWATSRKHIVTISSNGGARLNFLVHGMSNDKVEDFITKVQEAKSNRVNDLYKR